MTRRTPIDIRPLPIPVLVRIVNGWGDVPRREEHGEGEPYPAVERLVFRDPELWSDLPAVTRDQLIDCANRVFPIFDSASGQECADRLCDLIEAAGMIPGLCSTGWSIREVWRTTEPERALLAGAAVSILDHLQQDDDARRLGTCHGEDCADVYIDQSPAGHRQFCSVTCQNRARARAYRAHKRAEARAAAPTGA